MLISRHLLGANVYAVQHAQIQWWCFSKTTFALIACAWPSCMWFAKEWGAFNLAMHTWRQPAMFGRATCQSQPDQYSAQQVSKPHSRHANLPPWHAHRQQPPATMSRATLPPAEWPTITAESTSTFLIAARAVGGKARAGKLLAKEGCWPVHWVNKLCTSPKMDAVGEMKPPLEHWGSLSAAAG